MAIALVIPDTQLEPFPSHTVSLRQTWGAPWVVQPYLYATRFAKRAGPDVSTAELVYRYGTILRPDQQTAQVYSPLSIRGWYVLITVNLTSEDGEATPITWYGVIGDEGGARMGAPTVSGARVPTGSQTWSCYGLEWLLAREPLRRSTALDSVAGAEKELGRAIGFNVPVGRADDDLGTNRSADIGDLGTYVFAQDLASGQNWCTRDIIDYLLAYRTPRDLVGLRQIAFTFDAVSKILAPDWDQPRLKVHSETPKELIDKLLNRRRLVGWYLDVAAGVPTLYAFSFAALNVDIGGFSTLQANTNQVSIDFDDEVLLAEAVVKKTQADQYDQVVVRGDRKGACFTIGYADGTLVSDWAASIETEYVTAASTQADYPTLVNEEQERNRLWRSADRYKRVYSYFAVPATWDGQAGDGAGGAKHPVFVVDDQFTTADTFWRPGLLFAQNLPLLTDHDYTGSAIVNGTVTDSTPVGSTAERLRPMIWLKAPGAISAGAQWQHGEKPAAISKTDKHAIAGGGFLVSCRTQDRELGLVVRVSGAPQHAIAGVGSFTPVDLSDSPALVDWRNALMFTVYCQADHNVECRFPAEPPDAPPEPEEENPLVATSNGDYVRTLEIDLGGDAKLDYVPAGTVVAVKDGIPQRTAAGGYVRDDRPRMNYLAQVAWNWYSQERQAITLSYRTITDVFALGMLVVSIGSGATLEPVNAPITSVEWDLEQGTTTVTTGYGELDLLQFGALAGAAPAPVGGLGAG